MITVKYYRENDFLEVLNVQVKKDVLWMCYPERTGFVILGWYGKIVFNTMALVSYHALLLVIGLKLFFTYYWDSLCNNCGAPVCLFSPMVKAWQHILYRYFCFYFVSSKQHLYILLTPGLIPDLLRRVVSQGVVVFTLQCPLQDFKLQDLYDLPRYEQVAEKMW